LTNSLDALHLATVLEVGDELAGLVSSPTTPAGPRPPSSSARRCWAHPNPLPSR